MSSEAYQVSENIRNHMWFDYPYANVYLIKEHVAVIPTANRLPHILSGLLTIVVSFTLVGMLAFSDSKVSMGSLIFYSSLLILCFIWAYIQKDRYMEKLRSVDSNYIAQEAPYVCQYREVVFKKGWILNTKVVIGHKTFKFRNKEALDLKRALRG